MVLLSKDKKIILRDFLEEDINDYVIWNTEITEWQDWDAPWEKEDETKEFVREKFENYFSQMKKLNPKRVRTRFEICVNDINKTHIGWVISYHIDESYKYTKLNGLCTIGIDIPNLKYRKNGYGTSALLTYIDYLKSLSINHVYTQTWSGNYSMIKLAEKLGFIECNRLKKIRTVNGIKYDAITWKLNVY